MHNNYILLLAVVIFLTKANASPKASKTGTWDWSGVDIHKGGFPNRFLRSNNEDDEERAFGIKSIPGADKVSSYLTKQKLANYLKKDTDTEAVFAMLKLDTAGEKLFEDPKILSWLKYVDEYNAKNPAKATTPLTTLKKTYNDETLLNMLQTASQVWSTRSVAMRLETEQMKVWKSKGFTVDDLFKKYKLDSDLNPFANPAITILGRYSDEFNPNKEITLFSILQRKYTGGKLAQLLGDARRVSKTQDLAVNLQAQQLYLWLNKLKSPQTVFHFLKLESRADNLLDNPQLILWFHCVDFFEQNTNTSPFVKSIKATVAEMLARRYDSNDLKTLMKSGTSSVSMRLTAMLENELLDIWAKGGKSLEYVTKTLGTSPTKTKLVQTVYVDKLTNQRFRVWLDNLESPESVFKFLMLDKAPENLLDSPQLKAWLQY
ncbi:RxLR effector protein, partial [Phytophthora megakarya]